MASEDSKLSDISNELSQNLHLPPRRQIDFPDYPKITDFPYKEAYYDAVKEFFKEKGFKHIDEFSDKEKQAIIEDTAVNMMGSNVSVMTVMDYHSVELILSSSNMKLKEKNIFKKFHGFQTPFLKIKHF